MSGQGIQGAIPKFASFKPRDTADIEESKVKSEQRPGTTSRTSKARKHHHHHSRRSISRERASPRKQSPPPTAAIVSDDSSNIYVIDRQGDVKNLVYGSIHRYSVPPFHRVGAGSVLGTKRWLKIDRDVSDEKGMVLSDRNANVGARREKYVFARNEKKASRLLRFRPDAVVDGSDLGDADFVPLQEMSRKGKRSEGAGGDDSDEGKDHYRSIEGKAKASSKPADDALEYFTESDDSDAESKRTIWVDEATRQKSIGLSRNVDEHPGDIDAWIHLIDHQDKLLGMSDEGRRNITAAERRSTADIKLHLYEKALVKAGSTLAAKERLLLGLMAEGAKIWDLKTQSEKWEQVSRSNLDSALLWKQYLDFRQSSFTAFRYEEVKDIFLRRIKLLKSGIEDPKRPESTVEGFFESLIYATLRLTLLMRESGYSEISVALWQAILEFNFLGPSFPPSSSNSLEAFKDFWESEVPRIGEDGATGWKFFNEAVDAPDGKIDDETPLKFLESSDIFDGWVSAEIFRESVSKEPARTLDDVTEDDPYRVILWSDVEDFMIDLSTTPHSARLKKLLLDAYLLYSRLPPCSSSETSQMWWGDSFVRGEILEWSSINLDGKRKADVDPEGSTPSITRLSITPSEGTADEINPFQPYYLHSFVIEAESLFAVPSCVRAFQPWRNLYDDDDCPLAYSWLRSTLKTLVNSFPDEELGLYYLAFEWSNEPSSVKKVAKGLLKQRPQDLRLYDAYASIEWLRGNKDMSVNVITSALGMKASLPESQQQNCILLWKTWSWILLESGDTEASLRCLYSIADGPQEFDRVNASSPALFLKTRQHLSSMRDYLASQGAVKHANIYTECLALTVYLSSTSGTEIISKKQGDIVSALQVFDDYSETLKARGHKDSLLQEASHQAAARLLYHHVQFGSFRPALVRQYMSKSLALFPKNTIFLSLYTWNESRLRIDDRVRTILRSVILISTSDNITSRLFAIRYEMQSGNVHSIRAAFENATASPACSSNAGLWRLYIAFCARTKEFRKQAKEVFYRGVRACPWAKKLYMMAFLELKGLMGFEELRGVYKVLAEKELRVHVDLEDRLEEWDDRRRGRKIGGPWESS